MNVLPYSLPDELEAAINEVLTPSPLKRWAPRVARLSAQFTSNRPGRPRDYFESEELRAAYIAYFLRANFNKLEAVLDEMKPLLEEQLRRPGGLRVLDVGSGPGTMTLSALYYLRRLEAPGPHHFLAVDASAKILQECRRLFEAFRNLLGTPPAQAVLETQAHQVRQVVQSWRPPRSAPPDFDLILLGNVWNEMVEDGTAPDSAEFLASLAARLHPTGAMIFIEPALRESSRALHRLHDVVLENVPPLNVFAPCVHQQKCPCVAAGNEKDWCHAEHAWHPGETVRGLDRLLGLRKDALKFSYLVLRKDGKNILDLRRSSGAPAAPSASWRVVSERLTEKGKQRAFLCGQRGRLQFTRLNRHSTEGNAEFGRLERGDLVTLTGTEEKPGEIRVVEQAVVKKL
ncbi:MAG: small ribosomal subunit Rsm22 family protein [Acidobacteriia bacterium]|nr:small ribosomal subunit Rsm22 family protein [Terriglobia bacterium]